MKQGRITITTRRTMELVDITSSLHHDIAQAGCGPGLCHISSPHTTAGITINEGADPAVARDIIAGLKKIVPLDYPFEHGEGNSAAHIMTSLTGISVQLFYDGGFFQLGTWQRIFFCEFDGPRTRGVRWLMLEERP